jgi:spore coat polysaccharide biosynthesis predicted glycosyltransferase SpsG
VRQRIILRADGNATIGFGHVYRLLALADILKEKFYCFLAINKPDAFIKAQIIRAGVPIIEIDTDKTSFVPDQITSENQVVFDLQGLVNSTDILVVDGYQFGLKYQEGLEQTGCKQVYIDDMLASYPYADAVINHAPGIQTMNNLTHTPLCLGLQYAILRKPFFEPIKLKAPDGRVAFISLGGSDYFGFTLHICQLLLATDYFNRIHVLCTTRFEERSLDQLKQLEEKFSVTLHFDLGAQEIVSVMDTCTHAFVSASTVLIESYFRGLVCFAGYYSKNQLLIYNGFVQEKLALGMGDFNTVSAEEINRLLDLSDATVEKEQHQITDSKANLIALFESVQLTNNHDFLTTRK